MDIEGSYIPNNIQKTEDHRFIFEYQQILT